MKIRPPTPLHGWRVFVGEVGIIVLGVLLALAAQQAVEGVKERADIADLSAALRTELGDARARWEDMKQQDGCALRRLDEIEHWLSDAPDGAKLDRAYDIILRNLNSHAWDIAKMSPVSAEIPLKERLTYASLYGSMENWRSIIVAERNNADELSGLLASGNRPSLRPNALALVHEARTMVLRRQRNYPYFFQRFDELGIRSDKSGLDLTVNSAAVCQPLSTA